MSKEKGRLWAFAFFLLVLGDVLFALWGMGGTSNRAFSEDIQSAVGASWGAAVELEPVLGHALGGSVKDFPPVMGLEMQDPVPVGMPPRAQLNVKGEWIQPPGGERVQWSLRDQLQRSVVQIVSGMEAEPCTDFDGLRLTCGTRAHEFVGKYAGPMRGLDIPCVWMHPAKTGDLLIQVHDLPKTDRLWGFASLLDGSGKRASVHVEGRFNGRKVFKAKLAADRKLITLKGKNTLPAPGDLELRVRTDDPHWRLLCMGLFGLAQGE